MDKASMFLENVGCKVYIPVQYDQRENKPKRKFLFPGYVFIYFKKKVDYDRLNSTPYTLNLVRHKSKLVEIPDDQMDRMINHLDSIYATSNFSDKKIGDTIKIQYGILEGAEGTVIDIRNNKIYIQSEVAQSTIEIALI